MTIEDIVVLLERKVAILQAAIKSLKEADDIKSQVIQQLEEVLSDEPQTKRSQAMRRAWERRKKSDGPIKE